MAWPTIRGRNECRAAVSAGQASGNAGAFVRRTWRHLELRFNGAVTQTRMSRWAPDWLCIGYTRSMLAALWLHPASRTIGIVGLGGGAQAKFCYRHWPQARIEVVENDAGVLALREHFHIPANDARLAVVQDDGANWLRQRRGRFDLLLVDAYDSSGLPPQLDCQPFYDLCREALGPEGVMAINLYDTDLFLHRTWLREAFGKQHLLLPEPGMSNEVAIAWRGSPRPPSPHAWLRTLPLSARWQLREGVQRLAGSMLGANPP
ncbi:MAG TPA: transferase [Stenotrophomonas sp.]|nr:transferase [Stenotrophomonas sp.]